ncbi:chromosome transmission fidelity protein 8 homolog [Limulus polyphemus]|uniref:Chromosome transmission fidelity protein 8 homolog n=1 Tax=Limulus polyphemus TaxID=6850 RepID=A0ABM1BEC6_LIMPO|nr:chromosome transmission fidelity protein 8 homolog [Limulus polyphemus]
MVQILIRMPTSEDSKSGVPDWAVVELQGDLESKSGQEMHGSFVGDLHYTKKGAILIIGHHILFGKTVDVDKPFIVLRKKNSLTEHHHEANMLRSQKSLEHTQEEEASEVSVSIENLYDKHNYSTYYEVHAIVRKKILFKTRPKPIVTNVPKKL